MEALTTVFEYIKNVLTIIKGFFEEIMGIVKPDDEGEATE